MECCAPKTPGNPGIGVPTFFGAFLLNFKTWIEQALLTSFGRVLA
jgi:hypothetical protein